MKTAKQTIQEIEEKATLELIKEFDLWITRYEQNVKVIPSRHYAKIANYCFSLQETKDCKEVI